MVSPHSAQCVSPGPWGNWLRARSTASFTVASICSLTAPSPAHPVAMHQLSAVAAAGATKPIDAAHPGTLWSADEVTKNPAHGLARAADGLPQRRRDADEPNSTALYTGP